MPSGFDGNDIRGDRPDEQSGAEAGDDVSRGHRPMQKEDVDQLTRGGGITVSLSRCRPECFMR